jgi:Galactocerebrosidase, C-terminal lectin domain
MDETRLPPFRSIKLPIAAVAAACAIACAGSATLAQTGTVMIAIDKMNVGAAPADFEFARTGQGGPGRWVVISDATAAGGRAIEQSSRDATSYRFPLAIFKGFSAANAEVQIRFKPISGKVDQAGGIALRLASPDDYYVVRANALEDNVRFYRVVNGKREQLGTADTKVAPNQWHTLGLKAEGDRFAIALDGKQLYSVTDKTFSSPGRVALWTKADSVTRFDRLDIKPLN